ncbi:variable surface protein Vir25 [Plasmodium vivax India VII]|uniref:Variable surface protein Vir25 n=1 Tax=Plasmodium vivax India VII TaxID=1077284 RepID=A0A0J9S597_PLAVI|nr:variable surface protein Vir25 [Plasmodium vivax India VII]
MQYEKNCLQEKNYNQFGNKCKSIVSENDAQKKIINTICLIFHCLMHSIFNSQPSQYDKNEHAHLEYMNYWLNHELHSKNADICPEYFYQTLRSVDIHNVILPKLRTNNNYIVKEEADNMYALYHLYNKYVEMNEIVKSNTPFENTFFSYARNIVQKYKELAKKCTENNKFLCNALYVFKQKYKKIELKGEKLSHWDRKTLPPLVESDHSQGEITELKTRNSAVLQTSSADSVRSNEPIAEVGVSAKSPGKNEVSKEKPGELFENSVTSIRELSNPTNSHLLSWGTHLKDGANAITSDEDSSTGLKGEGDLSDYTRTIIGPTIGTIGMSSIFFIFYKVR